MRAKISLFGQLTDIAGNNIIVVDDVADTDALAQAVNKLYPAMAGIKYIIAIDKKPVHTNTALNEAVNIALLPPFSGG
ncbi:MAG: MoaD/ThiS family protein [Bacteroidota bacterium]